VVEAVAPRMRDYRLVVAVDFEKGIVWIKWLGTHRDYDRIDVKEVKHGRP
jgi:mRNA interferase HigB